MVATTVITVDAVFEDGLLRPLESLPFGRNERVTLRIDVPAHESVWPADTAEIYAELDREACEQREADIGEIVRERVSELLGDYLRGHGGRLNRRDVGQPDFMVYLWVKEGQQRD